MKYTYTIWKMYHTVEDQIRFRFFIEKCLCFLHLSLPRELEQFDNDIMFSFMVIHPMPSKRFNMSSEHDKWSLLIN